jgi:hypothetical protein
MVNLENKQILKILQDARTSRIYLDETQDAESARGRRCVNLLQNVAWLMSRNPQMINIAANKFSWFNRSALGPSK